MQGALDLDVLCEKLTQLEGAVSGDSSSTPRSKGIPSKDPEVGVHCSSPHVFTFHNQMID